MGLIKATVNATLSTLKDTWKDYFVCESLNQDILMIKGEKKGSTGLFSKSQDDIITNGSGIVVNEGQCALIIEDGKILEVAAETGYYTFDSEKSPSVFDGGFKGISDTFKELSKRVTFDGHANTSQCVYYVNTKEIMQNLFGTATPIPFRVIDNNIGLDIDISIRCNGEFSFKIVDPLLFYTNVAGNKEVYLKSDIINQLKSEFLTALQPAFATISANGVRYSEVPMHAIELADALNEHLSSKWGALRGIEVVSIGINSISTSKENEEMIKNIQKSAVYRDPSMAAATLVGAQADAMRDAAKNQAGAFTGFMGMNMANQSGGVNAAELFTMGQKQNQVNAFCPKCGNPVGADDLFCSKCGNKLK